VSRAALQCGPCQDLFVRRGGRQRRLGTTVWSHSVRMACITLAYKWFVGTQSDHMGSKRQLGGIGRNRDGRKDDACADRTGFRIWINDDEPPHSEK